MAWPTSTRCPEPGRRSLAHNDRGGIIPTIDITLDDETARKLAAEAAGQGLDPGTFLADAITQFARASMLHLARHPAASAARAGEAGREWMPRERWDALVQGQGCPLCAVIASAEPEDSYALTIADLGISRLRLARNQSVPGYCVLLCSRHVREPYDLDPAGCALFFEDMMRAALALERVFRPVKMNFEILGNAVPHLHCHIKPRFYGDAAPGMPIWPDARPLYLEPEAHRERAALIRQALDQGAN